MKRILLVTLHSQNNNFGSVLQANSLYAYLTEAGYDVDILDYRPFYSNGAVSLKAFLKKAAVNTLYLPQYIRRSQRFETLLKSEQLTRKFTDIADVKKCASEYDIFMIGSDQVWNPHYLCGKDPTYFLDFVESPNKLSYAASIGTDNLTSEEIINIGKRISKFRFVSFREKRSVVQLKNVVRNAEYVLDPVFLYSVEHYKAMENKYIMHESGYILAYVIHKDPFIAEVIAKIAKELKKKVIQVGGFAPKCKYNSFPRSAGPAEFLTLLDHADYVVTSSFHGTAFSHIYHKQFAVVMPHGNELRIENILQTAGTTDRVIKSLDDTSKILKPIDYDSVDIKINFMRNQSKNYLKKALSAMEKPNENM
ncbi:MAG: polysaccharide pyruvyl transferase family protein [Oscillospiraceae bacterium]|jgi:hypothetical protein